MSVTIPGVPVRRLALIAVVLAALVFGVEGVLALLRQRNINVTIQVESSLPTPAPEATQPGSGATPAANDTTSTLIIDPDGRVLVAVRWDYKIGPTFPQTVMRAQAFDQLGKAVASNTYTIKCGNASLGCSGAASLSLDFGVLDNVGTRAAWPAGDYTVQVTRAFTDLNTTVLLRRVLKVVVAQ
jgi:hypothetical protein